jgi:hypothetical protein
MHPLDKVKGIRAKFGSQSGGSVHHKILKKGLPILQVVSAVSNPATMISKFLQKCLVTNKIGVRQDLGIVRTACHRGEVYINNQRNNCLHGRVAECLCCHCHSKAWE